MTWWPARHVIANAWRHGHEIGGRYVKIERKGNYMNKHDVERILHKLKENTQTEIIRIRTKVSNERLPLTASKFGGFPYWTDVKTYPKSKSGVMLTLLAQINFADLPQNRVFPHTGLLQFFLLDGSWPGEYRVVFHKEVNEDVKFPASSSTEVIPEGNHLKIIVHSSESLGYVPFMPTSLMPQEVEITGADGKRKVVPNLFWGNEGFPIVGELALEFSLGSDCANMTEDCFEGEFIKAAEQLNIALPEPCVPYYILPEGERDVFDAFFDCRHKMLGHPYFVQGDTRTNDDVLLLQIDSAYEDSSITDRQNYIVLGDAGVCRFFVPREDLLKMNFSRVTYDWDCC